jgi:hypothetical protein
MLVSFLFVFCFNDFVCKPYYVSSNEKGTEDVAEKRRQDN